MVPNADADQPTQATPTPAVSPQGRWRDFPTCWGNVDSCTVADANTYDNATSTRGFTDTNAWEHTTTNTNRGDAIAGGSATSKSTSANANSLIRWHPVQLTREAWSLHKRAAECSKIRSQRDK